MDNAVSSRHTASKASAIRQLDNADRIQGLMNEWHVPGLSIAVINGQEIVSQGFGKASLSPSKPCTADTLFDIASCSKSLTAAAVALLVEDEKYPQVRWDAKMCDLLPEDFVMAEASYTRDVTVEDVLSHRTGLPSHDLSYFGIRAKLPDTPRSVTRNLRNLPVTAPIRTKFQYCNMMYTVATHLIETISGMSFEEFLHINFFKPLGMASSHLQPLAAKAAGLEDRITTAFKWLDESDEYRPVPLQHMPEAQGAGQIVTSVNDYAKWVRALMRKEHPVTEAVLDGVTRPRILDLSDGDDAVEPFTSLSAYAAGWEVRWYRGHRIIQHDGGIPGFGSVHFFLPGFEFGGVIFGNSDDGNTIGEIVSKELIDEILNVPEIERQDWNAWYHKEEQAYDEGKEPVAKQLCPDLEEPQPQEKQLDAYVGSYWNPGYREMKVEVKDGKLFIDASDRSMAFYLTLEHVCNQTKYVGRLTDYFDGTDEEVAVQFTFENDRVVSLGIKDEETFDEYVWYQKQPEMSI